MWEELIVGILLLDLAAHGGLMWYYHRLDIRTRTLCREHHQNHGGDPIE